MSPMDRTDEDDLAEIKRLLDEAGVPWAAYQADRVKHVIFMLSHADGEPTRARDR